MMSVRKSMASLGGTRRPKSRGSRVGGDSKNGVSFCEPFSRKQYENNLVKQQTLAYNICSCDSGKSKNSSLNYPNVIIYEKYHILFRTCYGNKCTVW